MLNTAYSMCGRKLKTVVTVGTTKRKKQVTQREVEGRLFYCYATFKFCTICLYQKLKLLQDLKKKSVYVCNRQRETETERHVKQDLRKEWRSNPEVKYLSSVIFSVA